MTSCDLRIFDAIPDNGSTAESIANEISCSPEDVVYILNALAGIGLLRKQGEQNERVMSSERG